LISYGGYPQDSQERTSGTGQKGQYSRDRLVSTRSSDRFPWTGQRVQDCQDMTARTGQRDNINKKYIFTKIPNFHWSSVTKNYLRMKIFHPSFPKIFSDFTWNFALFTRKLKKKLFSSQSYCSWLLLSTGSFFADFTSKDFGCKIAEHWNRASGLPSLQK
jgi:hypothetical protein